MSVTIAGLPFDFIQTDQAAGTVGFVFKSTRDAFYYNGTTVTKITDADYPATTVRGLSYRDWETDRKSTRLNSSHSAKSRMPSSA